MPETINNKQIFSLLEVTTSIRKTLSERYKSAYWIKAEMNKLNFYSYSGHCYPELVEKSDGKVVAQIKATLWKNDYDHINRRFLDILKEPLKDGIKIMFCANITFDPVHGLNLRIIDIDPTFSLGELEREKQLTIEKLKEEGIFGKNKSIKLPLLPKRIAIISVETSKGYGDFVKVIDKNNWGYRLFHMLFPALLQGDKSISSIINQLNRIEKVTSHFDVVAIIRGGGGDVGLSSFNNYDLSKKICEFPIPVITGIGHVTNETVCEMVSYKNAITPTELGEFLIQKFHNFSVPVKEASEKLISKSRQIIKDENLIFNNNIRFFQSATQKLIQTYHHEIDTTLNTLFYKTTYLLKKERETQDFAIQNIKRGSDILLVSAKRTIDQNSASLIKYSGQYIDKTKVNLTNAEKIVSMLDPLNVLKRGYTITLYQNKAIKSLKNVATGVDITTITHDGQIISNIKSIKESDHE